MLIKLAWKNIWRNKTRSVVVIIAVTIGLLAGTFASAFMMGLLDQKVKNIIDLEISNIQIHHKKFREDLGVKNFISNADNIEKNILKNPNVANVSSRLITTSMLASANYTNSIKLIAVDPEIEKKLSTLHTYVEEGEYFEGIKRNPILISQETAEKYKISLKSKVVLTFLDVDNNMVSASFRVVGIYNSKNGPYDKMNAFVRKQDLKPLLNINNGVHEIVIQLNDNELSETEASKYQKEYPNLEVLPWLDLSSGMRYMLDVMDTYTLVIVGIIMIALIFSIINTMLMAVMERTKEIGMLMAVGMARSKIFIMIILESVYLTMIGGPFGLILSAVFIHYFGIHGLDLGSSGEAYQDLGFSAIVYPSLGMSKYIQITFMVIIMAILGAIYPARKALKLKPVEALRKI